MKIKAFIFNNRLILVLLNPLIEHTNFDLYNILPLPIITQNNSHIFIRPSSRNLALSKNKLQYVTLSDFE